MIARPQVRLNLCESVKSVDESPFYAKNAKNAKRAKKTKNAKALARFCLYKVYMILMERIMKLGTE
jgi:hypothetical protein